MIDQDQVRTFTAFIHHCAGQATRHLADPGRLQLTAVRPTTGHAIYPRFKIGDHEAMAACAIRCANMGYNVWVQGRTVQSHLPTHVSPKRQHTVWVFALVVDYDGSGHAPFADPESFAVQTSCHNGELHAHLWYLTSLSPEQGEHTGRRIRAASGADDDSGVISQDYRLPGTPNYPTPRKAAAGRVTEPTFGIADRFSRKIYSFEDFDRLLPPAQQIATTAVFFTDEPNSRTPMQVLEHMANSQSLDRFFSLPPKGDFSLAFCRATTKAFGVGIRPKELEDFILEFGKAGPASKWIQQGKLRLRLIEQWQWWRSNQPP